MTTVFGADGLKRLAHCFISTSIQPLIGRMLSGDGVPVPLCFGTIFATSESAGNKSEPSGNEAIAPFAVSVTMTFSKSDKLTSPCSPLAPLGIPKFKTGSSSVPVRVTLALSVGSSVVTVPIEKSGVTPFIPSLPSLPSIPSLPSFPASPCSPRSPRSPLAPLGNPKSRLTTSPSVLVTVGSCDS